MDSSQILAMPEGKTLEFKRDISSLKSILKTIVAFANTAGGIVVIGREDDGKIQGVSNIFKAEESLASAVADSIRPMMMPEIEIITFEGKPLFFIRVARWRGPFYLKTEGPEKGVYVRLGSTNRRAGPEILAELKRAARNICHDLMPCTDLTSQDIDVDRIKKVFFEVDRVINERKMESLGLLVPHAGRQTVSYGGLILFGTNALRNRYFPDARVSCARFRGADKAEFIDRMDVEGTVLDAIEEVPSFIKRNTRLLPKIKSLKRHDIPEYPEMAVREVLVNAIAHADYSLTGMRIQIAIYSDRMEIQNPGMLPFGMTMDDFKAGVSKIRNRVIARVLRELGLMEEWGSGYMRVSEACRSGGYPEPEWHELGTVMRVVFYPHPDVSGLRHLDVLVNVPANVPVNDRQKWFLEQLALGKNCRASDLAAHWSVTEKTAKRDIAALKKGGVIEFIGAPKNGYYHII